MSAAVRRVEFVRHHHPHEFVNCARRRNHHHPHSVAVLLPTTSGMVLCAESTDAEHRAEYGLVPPQARFNERICTERSLVQHGGTLVGNALTDRSVLRRLCYLGSSWGTKRTGAGVSQRTKYVHWYGAILSGSARHKLRDDATIPGYQNPRFMDLRELRGLWAGDALSADKWRMVRQAYVSLAQIHGLSLPLLSQFHQELAASQLLPLSA